MPSNYIDAMHTKAVYMDYLLLQRENIYSYSEQREVATVGRSSDGLEERRISRIANKSHRLARGLLVFLSSACFPPRLPNQMTTKESHKLFDAEIDVWGHEKATGPISAGTPTLSNGQFFNLRVFA